MSISHNYIYIHVYHPSRISPQPHPTPLAHHRAPGGLPVLSSNFSGCLSETRLCIYIDVTFSIRSTLSFPSPPVPSLYLCLHSFPENRFINTVYLDSIYIINIQYLLFSDLRHPVWQALGSTERLHFHFSLSRIGEGNGNPLQCSCPENPRDRGAWWAAVYGVTQIRTRLKWLSSSSSSSSFSYLTRTDSTFFLFIAEYYSIVYTYHNFFIRGHLGCFHVLPNKHWENRHFDDGHSDQCRVKPYSSTDLQFFIICDVEYLSRSLFIFYTVSTTYLLQLAFWRSALFWILFRWFTPGYFLRAGLWIAISPGFQAVVVGNGHKVAAFLHAQLWVPGQPEP